MNIISKIVTRMILSDLQIGLYELVKLVSLIIFIAHFCACSFHFIGQIEIE
jgi:hypothetical protein